MNTRCPICLREHNGPSAAVLPCNHSMCRTCFVRFTVGQGGTHCPLCRAVIGKDAVSRELRARPCTRTLEQRVTTDLLVWRCRTLIRMMKKRQPRYALTFMVLEIVRAVDADATVRRAIAQDLNKLWFDPLTIRLFEAMGLFPALPLRSIESD